MILLSQLERTFATFDDELYSQKGSGLSTALLLSSRMMSTSLWW